jgi:hypothetical protein
MQSPTFFLYLRTVRFLLIISLLVLTLPAFAHRKAVAAAGIPATVIKRTSDKLCTDEPKEAPARLQSAKRMVSVFQVNESLLLTGVLHQSAYFTFGCYNSQHLTGIIISSHIQLSRLLLFPKHNFW